jgi:hypothetical protein
LFYRYAGKVLRCRVMKQAMAARCSLLGVAVGNSALTSETPNDLVWAMSDSGVGGGLAYDETA